MKRIYNFNAGPAMLPLEVLQEVQSELLDLQGSGMSILEMSHRAPIYEKINAEAEADIKELLGLGDDYCVLFMGGGASLQFSMVPMNFLGAGQTAAYAVTSNFSDKAVKEAEKVGKVVIPFSSKAEKYDRVPQPGEIRTPMNAIIGMSAVAFNYLDDKKRTADCLSKITFSSKHLLMLLNDVLDMSKIENGKLNIRQELFDLKNLVTSLADINYGLATAKGLAFEIVISGFKDELLLGDSMRVNQILLNLLSNAIKFTPKGGSVRLEIRMLRSASDKIWLRFIVKDSGIGMKKEFLEHLYEPFEQADNGIARKYGGTGLGMAITKNLVAIMDGTIEVESQEGAGTTFMVDLPFGVSKVDKKTAAEMEEMRVLVVDDDNDTCEHAAVLLKGMGVNVDWALNGFEAIEKVRSACEDDGRCYDVCFIDWCMPELDGIETARRMRSYVGPDVLIIIISAYDWSGIEEQAKAAGVNAFIAKPFFASNLYNMLLTVSRKPELGFSAVGNKETYDFGGKKVLLVEDNELNMEIASELLKFVNLQVEHAENGKVAVNIFRNSKEKEYALIFMDIQMPLMNGYDAARCIRSSEHPAAGTIPIIAMTANAFNDDVQAAFDAGMNGHLAKPIDVEVLYKTIARYI